MQIDLNELTAKKKDIIDELEKKFPKSLGVKENYGNAVICFLSERNFTAQELGKIYSKLNTYDELLKFEQMAERFFPQEKEISNDEAK